MPLSPSRMCSIRARIGRFSAPAGLDMRSDGAWLLRMPAFANHRQRQRARRDFQVQHCVFCAGADANAVPCGVTFNFLFSMTVHGVSFFCVESTNCIDMNSLSCYDTFPSFDFVLCFEVSL